MKLKSGLMLMFLLLFLGPRAVATAQEVCVADLKDVVITMKQENHCGCTDCCAVFKVSITGDYCRGKAVRLPPVSNRNRSLRRSAISSGEIVLTRAAASSMASGIPSSL